MPTKPDSPLSQLCSARDFLQRLNSTWQADHAGVRRACGKNSSAARIFKSCIMELGDLINLIEEGIEALE